MFFADLKLLPGPHIESLKREAVRSYDATSIIVQPHHINLPLKTSFKMIFQKPILQTLSWNVKNSLLHTV